MAFGWDDAAIMAASFFGSALQGAGNAAGSAIGSDLTTSLLGNSQSYDDFLKKQRWLDEGNPREIARQRTFLQEMAPAQAAAHNTFQDATYGADTQRSIDRIDQTSTALGMSPWEVLGKQNVAPAPAAPAQQQGDAQGLLSQMVPLKVAEMSNRTALAQTAMQTDSAQRIAAMQTAGGQTATSQVELNKAATELSKANQALAVASERKTNTEQYRTAQAVSIDAMEALYRILPQTEIDAVVMKSSYKEGWKKLAQYFAADMEGGAHAQGNDLPAIIGTISTQEIHGMSKELLMAVKAAGAVGSFVGGIAGAARSGMGFLESMTRRNAIKAMGHPKP